MTTSTAHLQKQKNLRILSTPSKHTYPQTSIIFYFISKHKRTIRHWTKTDKSNKKKREKEKGSCLRKPGSEL